MILIVDDRPENIYSLKAILSLHNFPIDTALSGEEALKKVLTNNYALIILDVQMPGMDGFEVAETISGYSKSKDIPIIFLSAANTDKKFIAKGYTSGGIDYITKPIDPDILLLKVKTFYRLYEQSRSLNEMHESLLAEIAFRKQAQQKANESAAELQSILESIPQLAFTANADGEIEYTNSKWLDYSPGPFQFPNTHPLDPSIQDGLYSASANGSPLEMEVRLKKKDESEYRCHLLRVLPIRKEDSVRWVGTFTDIEDQKQAVLRKEEFISIASHELKTPLSSIKGYAQLVQRIVKDEGPARLYVQKALLQVEKLNKLISDLLDISRIEHGKLKINCVPFDFEKMISGALEMAKETFSDYQFERTGSASVIINGDEIRLEQVLVNLISNAVKYSPDNKNIEVITENRGDRLYVGVRDHGIGISEAEQKKLFRKFYRVEKSATQFQGLGIGLYICSEILVQHNAEFGVTSEPGKGSTFYFTIPINTAIES